MPRAQAQVHALRRRRAALVVAGAALAGAAGCAGNPFGPPAPPSARPSAPAGGEPSGGRVAPFPAAAPFDEAGRRLLALDHLAFLVDQHGLFPGRQVYLLPLAPWVSDPRHPSPTQQWSLSLDGGAPLSLLAQAEPSGALDPAQTRIRLDGTPLGSLSAYVLSGVNALSGGDPADFAVLHLVLPALPPGKHKIEVETPIPAGARAAGGRQRLQVYDLDVRPPIALSALLLRDEKGDVHALDGGSRRLAPDGATLSAMGRSAGEAVLAAPQVLERLAAGPALPRLGDGALVGAEGHAYRLLNGRREWLPDAPAPSLWPGAERPVAVDPGVVNAIPPALRDGLLVRGGAPDVFHVHRGALRKVPPGTEWLRDNRLDPRDILQVPDELIATLPQDSPHWRTPGGVVFDRALRSATLGRPMPYRVYLPPDYDAPASAARRYPAIYLLHGNGGRYDEWSGYGLQEVANQLLHDGRFGQAIVVMPQGGRSYWVNHEGGLPWGDYVVRDVVSHVDATYRTIARREARAIGGLSMGGHGALQLTLNFPAVFGIAGAHSPSLPTRADAPAYFGGPAGFPRRDPFALARVGPAPEQPPQIWIDIGEADRWRRDAEAVHRALEERGWAHEWRLFPGSHDGSYWGDHLWEYLPFYAQAFARNGVGASG